MALLPTVGCYRYVPGSVSTAGVGQTMRVRLTLDGTRELASQLGPEVRTVMGTVKGVSGDTLRLEVTETRTIAGQVLVSRGNEVAIPRGYMSESEQRIASPKRAALTAALAVAGSVLLVVIMKAATGGSGGPSGGGGSPPV